jgi:serine/threonine-protein kinase RsbT
MTAFASATLESGTQAVQVEQDVVIARQTVRKLATHCGMRLVDQTKLITAASELARNTVIHGGGGHMEMQAVEEGARSGIRLRFVDEGPGIADMTLAMTDGWTSGTGLGLGLTGSRRLASEFDIQSAPGKGTRVTIVRWK